MVPTGKLTPITPARPTPRSLPLQPYRSPAPVVEYNHQFTEPPPLDPSYVPVTYKYLHYLIPKSNVYVPAKIKYPDLSNSKVSYYNAKYNSLYPHKYNEYSAFYKKPIFNSPYNKKY
ncbi:hypothetical protein WDU94_009424 [Cyamophila willieti]